MNRRDRRRNAPVILPLVSEKAAPDATPALLAEASGGAPARVRADGDVGARLHLYARTGRGGSWKHLGPGGSWDVPGGAAVGAAATPGAGAAARVREVTFRVGGRETRAVVAPVLLASSLDPVEEVLVVRNRLTARFADELARLVPTLDGRPTLRTLAHADDSSDIWMQDAAEIGRVCVPEADGKGARQAVAPLLGLRARHDMGLDCGPLDALLRSHFEGLPGAVPVAVGEPLPGRRWIDWFGNLEVSPPVTGFPHGRLLTGEQKGLRLHPDALAFLEAQRVQWPPLFLDVSWLTIGHVDEVINFVPAPDRQGFRALLPSPALARTVLEQAAAQGGGGDAPVFAGKKGQTTVARLLDAVARSEETRRIEDALKETRARLKEGLGVEAADIVEMPCLFRDGLAVIPNGVNGLVVGKDVVVPDPLGPVVAGEDVFRRAVRERLEPLGLRLHFIDIYEPYHARSGEIHCATNAVRRLRNPVWWN